MKKPERSLFCGDGRPTGAALLAFWVLLSKLLRPTSFPDVKGFYYCCWLMLSLIRSYREIFLRISSALLTMTLAAESSSSSLMTTLGSFRLLSTILSNF